MRHRSVLGDPEDGVALLLPDGGLGCVGQDPADAGCGQDNHIWRGISEQLVNCVAITQVNLTRTEAYQIAEGLAVGTNSAVIVAHGALSELARLDLG